VDCDAERELCRRYAGRIRGYGLRHLRDGAAAEDLVQHVLLIVLRAVREQRAGDPRRLDGYVLVTCRNSVMDIRRSQSRQRRLAERSAAEMPATYEPAWAAVDRLRIERCLRELEARDRAIVLATFLEDRDADEIGAAMQLSPGNVRVIRHRAVARLQACVEGEAAAP
jgi:RNA polymerase sigma-70 factor (ECF subfamily)